jgi:hypothetical protein
VVAHLDEPGPHLAGRGPDRDRSCGLPHRPRDQVISQQFASSLLRRGPHLRPTWPARTRAVPATAAAVQIRRARPAGVPRQLDRKPRRVAGHAAHDRSLVP